MFSLFKSFIGYSLILKTHYVLKLTKNNFSFSDVSLVKKPKKSFISNKNF